MMQLGIRALNSEPETKRVLLVRRIGAFAAAIPQRF